METLKRTPRTELVYRALLVKMSEVLDETAVEIGVDQRLVDDAMEIFAWISARSAFDPGEVDFELAKPSDTPDEIKTKFLIYMDTACIEKIEAAKSKLREMDRPVDPDIAPLGGDKEKK